MKLSVAIQGQPASFHDLAAREYFGPDIRIVCCDTFSEAFQALSDKKADRAVIAIENSLYGSINEVYDRLLSHKVYIIGEVYLRIAQCLIGLPGTHIEDIKEVHSHPVALAQCEKFLDTYLPRAVRFETHDTAGSVADVKRSSDKTKAAIASAAAAKLHDLNILATEIETHTQNYTRFVVLQLNKNISTGANKTSLVLRTDHSPGALYHALGAFAEEGINLTKLQSRPIVGKSWHYIFYVDVAASQDSDKFKRALAQLHSKGCDVTILGSYAAGHQD